MHAAHPQPTYLQQGGNSQCGYAAVAVGDEALQVHVACGDHIGMQSGHTREGFHCSIPHGGLGGAQEHLKHGHCWLDLTS